MPPQYKPLPTIWRLPDELWTKLQPLLPPEKTPGTPGRPAVPFRKVLDGILYVLRTGCQWKAVPKEYGSASTCHKRFQEGERTGVFVQLWEVVGHEYDELRSVRWQFQSLDSMIVKAPLGGRRRSRTPRTGPNRAASATS